MSAIPASPPSLQIESCIFRSVRVLSVAGTVDLDTEEQLERAIRESVKVGAVVIDLHEVRFFSIGALRMLLRCRRLGMQHGHPLVVASPDRQFLQLVSSARLGRYVPCFLSLGVACSKARQIDRARNPQPPQPPRPRG